MSSPHRCAHALLVVAFAAGFGLTIPRAHAAPIIKYVYPAGARRGSTVEVTVSGVELDGASGVRFAPADVSGRVVKVVDSKTVTISVQVPAGAELGERDLRLLTPRGASNRYRFQVGQLPEINEKQPNSTRADPQKLPALPVLVNGQILESQRDYYSLAAAAGQTIVCEVQARAILPFVADAVPGWLDACLTVTGPNGAEIDSVDDFRLDPDPVLIFKAPTSGEYRLEVRDILDRGRGDFVYRISVGTLPHIVSITPLGGHRGATTRLALAGANLPAPSLDYAVPADSPARRTVQVQAGGISSNSLPFDAADAPEIAEREPNDTAKAAHPVATSVVVNGRIDRPGDVDCYSIRANAGQTLVMEVIARRLGSPIDSSLALFDARGAKLAENDDTVDPAYPLQTHHADSRLAYTFPANGDYVLRVSDIQGKGGDDYTYRLSIGPPHPGYLVRSTPDSPVVSRGDTLLLTVTATRTDGFDGDIGLSVQGLPAGVTAPASTILRGQTTGWVPIAISAGAANQVFAPVVTASATIGGAPVTRVVDPSEVVMQAFSYTQYPTSRETVVTVVDGAGLSLTTTPSVVEVKQGGQVRVTVKAERAAGATGEVALSLAVPLQTITAAPPTIAADRSEAEVIVGAPASAPAGLLQNVVLAGVMRSGSATYYRLAPAITVRVVPK